jgi:riboflavin synthase
MFTGIVEEAGTVVALNREQQNLHITLRCSFASELKVDQSLAHNGVCLTVVSVQDNNTYTVTAIAETLNRTNLGLLKTGDIVNLERCLKLGDRLDGHMVQGHIDQTALCTRITDQKGSWLFRFEYDASSDNLTVQKGSICVNGVSLTVVDSGTDYFTVAIIPYTFDHTNFKSLKEGDHVNLEFDILGKYAAKMLQHVIR